MISGVKYTDKDGMTCTSYHRVVDIGLFMEHKMAEAKKLGGKAKAELVMNPKPLRKAA